MKVRDVDVFFEELSYRIDFRLEVILTGGAAAILFGVRRATYDIDFEIHLLEKTNKKIQWEHIQASLEKVSSVTRITPQYADDMDRWSTIALPFKKSIPYKTFGKINVRILEPSLWAVGKLTRFLSSDVSDLVTVLKSQTKRGDVCARLWGQALAKSPPSPSLSIFKKQVDRFLDEYAKTIWGAKANPENLKKIFLQAARGGRRIKHYFLGSQ